MDLREFVIVNADCDAIDPDGYPEAILVQNGLMCKWFVKKGQEPEIKNALCEPPPKG